MPNRVAIAFIFVIVIVVASFGANGWPSVMLGGGASAPAPSGPAPIAAYNMATAPPMVDIIGSSDGTCTVCPAWTATGGPNNGPHLSFFKGTGQNITIVGTTIDLHSHNKLTVMYDTQGNLAFLEKFLTRSGQFSIFGGFITDRPSMTIGGKTFVGPSPVSYDSFAWVFDGDADTLTLYVDGVIWGTSTGHTTDLTSNTSNIIISDPGTFGDYGGSITNLQFFDVALTAPEVAALAGVDL